MAFIDYQAKDIRLKVVFWGPRGSGKTAALQHIRDRSGGGEARRIGDAPEDAYYDILPLRLGDIRGFSTNIQLYTVPGGEAYGEARRGLVESVDGVVFVADSRAARMHDNLASVEELAQALRARGYDPAKIPLVLACGHADAPDATDPAKLAAALLATHPSAASVPVFAMDAVRGPGVFDALKAISKLVLTELKRAG